MSRNLPPIEKRFPVNRKDHTTKHPNGYLTPILKKLLNQKMSIKDPEVLKVLEIKTGTKADMKRIIMLRYILNAIQGENKAIEGILDRIDGRVVQRLEHSGELKTTRIEIKVVKNVNSPNESHNRLGKVTEGS